MIFPDGRQWWCLDGQLHRVDGPAVIEADGHYEWYLHGERHRVDGPAVIFPDGPRYWYVQGHSLTETVEDWMQANSITWPFNDAQQTEFALRWL